MWHVFVRAVKIFIARTKIHDRARSEKNNARSDVRARGERAQKKNCAKNRGSSVGSNELEQGPDMCLVKV